MLNHDATSFSEGVIEMANAKRMTFMDAMLELCELSNIDPSAVGTLVTPPLAQKIKQEATKLHFFKKEKSDDGTLAFG